MIDQSSADVAGRLLARATSRKRRLLFKLTEAVIDLLLDGALVSQLLSGGAWGLHWDPGRVL